jgi:hypothetical protein
MLRRAASLLERAPQRRLILRLVFFLLLSPGAALAGQFVAGTDDLPLMPGLTPVAGSSLVFDKPEGRIVEARARGAVSRRAVDSFYAATLPHLGWEPAGGDAWRRDGEKLRLDFAGRDGSLTVGFTLSPQ